MAAQSGKEGAIQVPDLGLSLAAGGDQGPTIRGEAHTGGRAGLRFQITGFATGAPGDLDQGDTALLAGRGQMAGIGAKGQILDGIFVPGPGADRGPLARGIDPQHAHRAVFGAAGHPDLPLLAPGQGRRPDAASARVHGQILAQGNAGPQIPQAHRIPGIIRGRQQPVTLRGEERMIDYRAVRVAVLGTGLGIGGQGQGADLLTLGQIPDPGRAIKAGTG